MTYATEHFANTLKSAREARGLSQRALSAKAGVPQSHISKIENGAVDLRVSSLVELARVLDLELMLVSRMSVSAVQAIVQRSAERAQGGVESSRQTLNELKRLQDSVAQLTQTHPTVTELAQIQRQVRELVHFRISTPELEAIRAAVDAVKGFQDNAASMNVLRGSLAQIRNLRNALAHGVGAGAVSESVRPAYSLDEDDHG